jgi:hypothetical protein
MRERDHKPVGTVRLNVIGRLWKDDSSGSPTFREILPQNQSDLSTLKASRLHSVDRLMSARLESKDSTLVPSQGVARVGVSDRPTGGVSQAGPADRPGRPPRGSYRKRERR